MLFNRASGSANRLWRAAKRSAEKANALKVFGVTFVYICFIGLFIQFVFIPYLVPQWNAGDGILVGSNDAKRFHMQAVSLAETIKVTGWQAWELRAKGNSPVGIAAAVYAILQPRFWLLIPFNAVLHALAASGLWKIAHRVSGKRWMASFAIAPFIFFPSSMQWTTQLHKDGMSIAGSYLCLLGWLLLLQIDARRSLLKQYVGVVLLVLSGTMLTWVSREDYVALLVGASLSFPLVVTYRLIVALYRRTEERASLTIKLSFAGILLLLMTSAGSLLTTTITPQNSPPPQVGSEQASELTKASQGSTASENGESLSWLGKRLDTAFSLIANRRYRYLSDCDTARSCIDTQIKFNDTLDLISYIPKATLIAVGAPFPQAWFEEGSHAPNTLMRRIAGIEMLITYLVLPGIIWSLARRKEKDAVIALLLFAYGLLLPMAIMVPNIGTLYRLRFGALMLLIAVGIIGHLRRIEFRGDQEPQLS